MRSKVKNEHNSKQHKCQTCCWSNDNDHVKHWNWKCHMMQLKLFVYMNFLSFVDSLHLNLQLIFKATLKMCISRRCRYSLIFNNRKNSSKTFLHVVISLCTLCWWFKFTIIDLLSSNECKLLLSAKLAWWITNFWQIYRTLFLNLFPMEVLRVVEENWSCASKECWIECLTRVLRIAVRAVSFRSFKDVWCCKFCNY